MERRKAVYELRPILDDPRFEGFATKEEGVSFRTGKGIERDFLPDFPITQRSWKAPRLARVWKPLPVIGRVSKANDFPCLNGVIPAFSQRAADALDAVLKRNGELLPLVSKIGSYYAYNVTTVADVLDQKRSKIRWVTKAVLASKIIRHEFDEKVEALTIFRIPEEPNRTYVTQTFADCVREKGLQGFHLIKLWPLPPRVSWDDLAETDGSVGTGRSRSGSTLKAQAVVIRLNLAAGRGEGSDTERSRIEGLMDRLDEILFDAASKADPVGSLEGHDYANGSCRLFLSCPDADVLVNKLMPWLEKLRWRPGFDAIKRYGNYLDPNAEEEPVQMASEKSTT